MAKILVVEDNPSIGMVIQLALTDEGHQVELRRNALAGLDFMHNENIPDLVLTDLIMSGMNGCDLIKKMRDDQQLHNIPAIIITGCTPNPEILPQKDEYQGLLIKPFDIDDLLGTVGQLIGKSCH